MSEGCAGWTNLGTHEPKGDDYKNVHWKHAAGQDLKDLCGKHYKTMKHLVATESTNPRVRKLFGIEPTYAEVLVHGTRTAADNARELYGVTSVPPGDECASNYESEEESGGYF